MAADCHHLHEHASLCHSPKTCVVWFLTTGNNVAKQYVQHAYHCPASHCCSFSHHPVRLYDLKAECCCVLEHAVVCHCPHTCVGSCISVCVAAVIFFLSAIIIIVVYSQWCIGGAGQRQVELAADHDGGDLRAGFVAVPVGMCCLGLCCLVCSSSSTSNSHGSNSSNSSNSLDSSTSSSKSKSNSHMNGKSNSISNSNSNSSKQSSNACFN